MKFPANFRVIRNAGALILAAVLAQACTPPDELDGDDLEVSMDWEELVTMQDGRKDPAPDEETARARPRPSGPAGRMGRIAALNAIENPTPYAGGLLGTKGDATKYFIASTDVVPGYNRLYWVIVKLLSERYSCFMRSKMDIGNMTRFTCKDGRQVVFWKKQSPGYIEFASRQFDREGYEIKVIRKKIVRISSVRVI